MLKINVARRDLLGQLRNLVGICALSATAVDGCDGEVVHAPRFQSVTLKRCHTANRNAIALCLQVASGGQPVINAIPGNTCAVACVPSNPDNGCRCWCGRRGGCWCWCWCWCGRWCGRRYGCWGWRWRCGDAGARGIVALLANTGCRITPSTVVARNRSRNCLVEVRAVDAVANQARAGHSAGGTLCGAVNPTVATAPFGAFHVRRRRHHFIRLRRVFGGIRCAPTRRQHRRGDRPQRAQVTPISLGFSHCSFPNDVRSQVRAAIAAPLPRPSLGTQLQRPATRTTFCWSAVTQLVRCLLPAGSHGARR